MANRHNWTVVGLTAGLLLVGSGSAIATSGGVLSVAVASLQTSEAASDTFAPGGPVVPDGCKNFGHWVSSEARGMTCEQNVRGGKDAHDSARP